MPSQLRAELYKLAHSRWVVFALLCSAALATLYGVFGHELMVLVAGEDFFNEPGQSIGFYWLVPMESAQISVVRSALAGTIFIWPILLVFCIMRSSEEGRQRTDGLLVAQGGNPTQLSFSKMAVSFVFCICLYFAFVFALLFIAATRLGHSVTAADVGILVPCILLNAGVLAVFMFLAFTATQLFRSGGITTLAFCLIPLIGVVLYHTNYRAFDTLAGPLRALAKMNPVYYWSNICALRTPSDLASDLLLFVLVFTAVGVLLYLIAAKLRARR